MDVNFQSKSICTATTQNNDARGTNEEKITIERGVPPGTQQGVRVARALAAFPCWIVIVIRWRRNPMALRSPGCSANRLPIE